MDRIYGLVEPLRPFVTEVTSSFESLTEDRISLMESVADYFLNELTTKGSVEPIFICTHNSRRSHLAQIWCQVAAHFYEIPAVMCYSGGTEATECNIRTIRAMRRAGLSIVSESPKENPLYLIQYADGQIPARAFSKKFSSSENPSEKFAAMMCCSDADDACPLVSGSNGRFQLHYQDPKRSDDSPQESAIYDESCMLIAREMFYAMSQLREKLDH